VLASVSGGDHGAHADGVSGDDAVERRALGAATGPDADTESAAVAVADHDGAMKLADERCEVCRPGTPHLSDEEASALGAELDDGWEIVGGHEKIRRRIKTKDFGESLALAVRIGMIAESEGHHPDLHVHWGRLVVDLTTHAAKGLTRNDFVLAAKIDKIA
jgi:4a-hydroxytetrahydrobiopterin dehydratase